MYQEKTCAMQFGRSIQIGIVLIAFLFLKGEKDWPDNVVIVSRETNKFYMLDFCFGQKKNKFLF